MMAEASTLARPYAQAIFNLANANNTLKAWSDQLALLKQVAANEDMIDVITNPDISADKTVELIAEICKDGLDEQGMNLIKLTAENGRLEILPEIADSFEAFRAEAEGNIEVQVISAYAVNATQKKSIAEALKKKLGREVTITTEIDKSLIGGLVIRAGDIVIDGSVKSQLEKITHSLLG
jgi:F-type H+-transporting ATPase subunit delta